MPSTCYILHVSFDIYVEVVSVLLILFFLRKHSHYLDFLNNTSVIRCDTCKLHVTPKLTLTFLLQKLEANVSPVIDIENFVAIEV